MLSSSSQGVRMYGGQGWIFINSLTLDSGLTKTTEIIRNKESMYYFHGDADHGMLWRQRSFLAASQSRSALRTL